MSSYHFLQRKALFLWFPVMTFLMALEAQLPQAKVCFNASDTRYVGSTCYDTRGAYQFTKALCAFLSLLWEQWAVIPLSLVEISKPYDHDQVNVIS